MIAFKSVYRIGLIAIAIVIIGIFLSGFVVWRLAVIAEQRGTESLADFINEDARDYLDHELMKTSKSEPSETFDEAQVLVLGYDVDLFRSSAISNPEVAGMAELPQVTADALQSLLEGEISKLYPHLWPYVMAGSVSVLGTTLSSEPIVAFYNPYFDVALLTKWRFKTSAETLTGPGFKLIEAVPVTGRAFQENRPSLSTDQPVWTDSDGIFELKIVAATQIFIGTFEERYSTHGRDSSLLPDAAANLPAIPVIENRVFDLLRWVIDAQNPDAPVNYAAEIKQLRNALSADSSKKLAKLLPQDNPQTADAIFQLDPEVRKGLAPYLVVDKNVIFIDPINLPTGFLSVYFTPAEKGYALGLAMLFNLETNYFDR